jgi:transcriptional regulator with XRE-family HTH domain
MEAVSTRAPVRGGEVTIVGRRLLEILGQRGWSLNKLAGASGISVSQLSLLTRGLIAYPRADTLQAICKALGVTESVLLGTTRRQADLQGAEGVTTVPVVRLDADGELEETGETYPVAVAQLDGRRRLFAAVVEGGGMAPSVMIGDRVLFDPDAAPAPEQMVLVSYWRSTRTAWLVDRDITPEYWLEGDRAWLDRHAVRVLGRVVYIMRAPPAYRAP